MTTINKIVVFDLDDTLYDEITFIFSGFNSVAKYLSKNYKLNYKEVLNLMHSQYHSNGRNKIFDRVLINFNIFTKSTLLKCINVYRFSKRKISLNQESKKILETLSKKQNLYLVTDGNKLVQKHKIKLLKIQKYFKKIFITHNYGLINSKPSLYCFNKICKLENIKLRDIVYIGDNPKKDFVNLNKHGSTTIRILRGSYKNIKTKKIYEAKIRVTSINRIMKYI